MPEKIKILYIDDEVNNLIGFKASFRLDYKILTAQNTDEAIDILNKNPDIHIIFCDQRMPEKTGVQFFEEIRNKFPLPIRILITGYTDVQSVIDAVNLGNIFRYVKKPWTESDIQSAVQEADKFYTTTSLLSVKNKELQKAYDELDKFSYSVTHDVRRPLLSMLGAIEVAQQIDDVEEIKQLLTLMQESVNNLDSFIQSLHDYYNINRGQLELVDIEFSELVKELQEKYGLIAKVSNVNFITSISQAQKFRSDKISLKIILNNLVSNAFKYQKKNNEDKRVELDVNVEPASVTITVKDNGIGIQDHHLGEIFDLFFRATSEEVGSGFGLYTVKDALLKLKGEIKVNSVFGEGSVFTVTIPNK
jgi:two-component system, sensor histidine kinase and response regulator